MIDVDIDIDKSEAALAKESFYGPKYWRYLGFRNKPWTPLAWQYELYNLVKWPVPDPLYPSTFSVVIGRRGGKTSIGEKLLFKGLFAPDDWKGPPTVRLTADTEEHAHKIWDPFVAHLETTPLAALVDSHRRDRNLITLKNGANVQMLSADNPNALAGDDVTMWIIDEAQYLTWEAWNNLLPSTSDRAGVIVLFGVAEGMGPFEQLSRWGMDPERPEFAHLSYPTSANPLVPLWRIELARRTLSQVKFEQLYLARWKDEIGRVFRNVDRCIKPRPIQTHHSGFEFVEPYRSGHFYYAGIDLGRRSDWSVMTVSDAYGNLIAWDRFAKVGWDIQKSRFLTLAREYGFPHTVVDTTGIGDVVFEDLVRMGLRAEAYPITTNPRKRALVDSLAIRMDTGTVSYPDISPLLTELRNFQAKKSKIEGSLTIVYTAPEGQHDDFVLSLSLLATALPKPTYPDLKPVDEPAIPLRQEAPWEHL